MENNNNNKLTYTLEVELNEHDYALLRLFCKAFNMDMAEGASKFLANQICDVRNNFGQNLEKDLDD